MHGGRLSRGVHVKIIISGDSAQVLISLRTLGLISYKNKHTYTPMLHALLNFVKTNLAHIALISHPWENISWFVVLCLRPFFITNQPLIFFYFVLSNLLNFARLGNMKGIDNMKNSQTHERITTLKSRLHVLLIEILQINKDNMEKYCYENYHFRFSLYKTSLLLSSCFESSKQKHWCKPEHGDAHKAYEQFHLWPKDGTLC